MRTGTSISTRLTRGYGLRHPFVGAGMGFVAYEELAAAVSNAGGLGMVGASPDPPDSVAVLAERLRMLTTGPWGVDLICARTALGPASTEAHIEACVQAGVQLVAFHHDPPPADWVRRLSSSGARVWMQVSSVELAVAAVELGVDGLVAQGSEAGGHARGREPLHSLLGALRHRFPDILVLGAGGIVDGSTVAAALRAGADGVWVGTALIAAEEAYAHPEYKDRLVRSTGETVSTTVFGPEWPDQPYRVLATPLAGGIGAPPADDPMPPPIGHTRLFPHSVDLPYEMPAFSNLPPTPPTSGNFDAMAYPAGQGVGAIRAVEPAATIVERMMTQAYAQL